MAVSTGQGEEDVMATINITPFTDVLLVLLIIFIILTSVTKEPKLPDALNRDKVLDSQIVVLIDDKDRISIGSHEVTISEAGAAFRQLSEDTGHRYKNVIIKANPNASYGIVLQVMDAAKSADLTNFGLANHIQGVPEGGQ
jgi:biopolymer transport protein ExbD